MGRLHAMPALQGRVVFFFFNDTATTEIYTLSLHDALPIWAGPWPCRWRAWPSGPTRRSEEHTSELQSQSNIVCRLLLEKKKKSRYHCRYASSRPQPLITSLRRRRLQNGASRCWKCHDYSTC